jgi:hypothetical protein
MIGLEGKVHLIEVLVLIDAGAMIGEVPSRIHTMPSMHSLW